MTSKAFYLTEQHVKRLRRLARDTGLNEAEHVRRALDAYFEQRKDARNSKKTNDD